MWLLGEELWLLGEELWLLGEELLLLGERGRRNSTFRVLWGLYKKICYVEPKYLCNFLK